MLSCIYNHSGIVSYGLFDSIHIANLLMLCIKFQDLCVYVLAVVCSHVVHALMFSKIKFLLLMMND